MSGWRVRLLAALCAFGTILPSAGSARSDRRVATAHMPAPGSREEAARHVDREALMAIVRTLSSEGFTGRRTGTPGADAARDFIVRGLEAAGTLPAFTHGFRQTFDLGPRRTTRRAAPDSRTRGYHAANVAGLVRGTAPNTRFIVVSAHFDHVGILDGVLHPGADDNASGVAVLLAAAGHFASHRPRHSMVFAAFDAEELDLAGARAFVRDPPVPVQRMAINVNLDMVARSDRREIFAAGVHHSPWLEPILQEVQRRSSVRIRPGYDRPSPDERMDWTTLSDHAAFHEAGVPFLYFGVEDHADYHGPGDTVDRIDAAFFGDVADMVVETLIVLDRELR